MSVWSDANRRWNKKSYAHKMVAELQVEMAHAVYDALASKPHGEGDRFVQDYPSETAFVNMVAPTLRDDARATLAEMLARDDVSDSDKNKIYDALLMDACIPNEDRWHVPPPIIQ